MAQALVRACEGVAAAANFLDIYIQAAVIRRDSSSLLGSWLSQEYQVTIGLGQSSSVHMLHAAVPYQKLLSTFGCHQCTYLLLYKMLIVANAGSKADLCAGRLCQVCSKVFPHSPMGCRCGHQCRADVQAAASGRL